MDLSKSISEIIKISSLSGHERNLADYLFTQLLILGLKPQKQDGNVVARIAGKNPEKALIFNAHMDTVSAGALSLWKFPPYGKDAGIHAGGKVYGLGASDDKASIATLLLVAEDLIANKPPMDIWITFVREEETGGDGTKSFLAWFEKNDWLNKYSEISAVICEPTDMEEVRIGHRGNFNASITVKGEGGHGSQPHLIKKQAIFDTIKVIDALKKLEKDWQKKFSDHVLGNPSIAITSMHAGDTFSPNKFPDTSTITIDVRTTPKLDKKAWAMITELAKKHEAEAALIYHPAPPGYTDPSQKIVVLAKKLVGKIGLGKGSTDLCFFSELGIPGVILGPGNRDIIHKPNEYCEMKKMEKGIKIYKSLISKL